MKKKWFITDGMNSYKIKNNLVFTEDDEGTDSPSKSFLYSRLKDAKADQLVIRKKGYPDAKPEPVLPTFMYVKTEFNYSVSVRFAKKYSRWQRFDYNWFFDRNLEWIDKVEFVDNNNEESI